MYFNGRMFFKNSLIVHVSQRLFLRHHYRAYHYYHIFKTSHSTTTLWHRTRILTFNNFNAANCSSLHLRSCYKCNEKSVGVSSKPILNIDEIKKQHQVLGYSFNTCASLNDSQSNLDVGTNGVLDIKQQQKNEGNQSEISEDDWFATAPERKIGLTKDEQNLLLRQKPIQPVNPRVLKVAIIGAPNAGKSTLANQLLGWRYSAVSSKVNTTRHKSVGVMTEKNTQLIFLDTPGMISPDKRKRHRLERSLLTDPHSSLYEADIIIVVVDVSEVWHRHCLNMEILKALYIHKNKHIVLVQNKTDLYGRVKDLMHTSRILSEGSVAGKKDWFTPLKHKSVNLDTLFDKVDLQRKQPNDSLEKKCEKSKVTENLGDDLSQDCNMSEDDDSINYKTEYMQKMTEPEGNDRNSSILSGNISNEIYSVDRQYEWEGKIPNFNNNEEWNLYYNQYLKKIGREIEDKQGFSGFQKIFNISALNNSGVNEIKDYLIENAKPGLWIYNESVITDLNPIEIAKMCVWEKLLNHLPKEVPYTIDIKLSLWEVDESGMLRAMFDLICDKKRDMQHLLADSGIMREIAMEAKQELMNTFRREMSLYIVVRPPTDHKKK